MVWRKSGRKTGAISISRKCWDNLYVLVWVKYAATEVMLQYNILKALDAIRDAEAEVEVEVGGSGSLSMEAEAVRNLKIKWKRKRKDIIKRFRFRFRS